MILRQIDAAIDAFRGRARSLRKSAKDYDRPQDDAMAAVYECEISTLIALREIAEQMEINAKNIQENPSRSPLARAISVAEYMESSSNISCKV